MFKQNQFLHFIWPVKLNVCVYLKISSIHVYKENFNNNSQSPRVVSKKSKFENMKLYAQTVVPTNEFRALNGIRCFFRENQT